MNMAFLQIEGPILLCTLSIFLYALSWTVQGQQANIDLIVAKDGKGNFTKIMDAIAAAPKFSKRRYNIRIMKGKYTENVIVGEDKKNINFIGDGIDQTIISGSKSSKEGIKTYYTATLAIEGVGFTARDMTIENTAGAVKEQAVALRSIVNSAFYHCKFLGYQDTLYSYKNMQFYRECKIYGTIDFIFGDATVILQNCGIYLRLPPKGASNTLTITAQGRKESDGKTGIVIHNCTITADDDLKKNGSSFIKSYLGRPWANYSRTVVMQSFIDNIIDPRGWLEWNENSTNVGTIFYAEYQNRGPGASTDRRVKWKGYHKINRTKAIEFTVRNFISWHKWLPSMGIPFLSDLI